MKDEAEMSYEFRRGSMPVVVPMCREFLFPIESRLGAEF